jgi:hypothetical protein
VPVSTDYNFTIEQQLPGSLIARVAYVGSASRHLFVNLDNNPAVNTGTVVGGKLTFPSGTSNDNARRVYDTAPTVGPCTTITGCNESYQSIVEAAMIGSAHYNSLQGTLVKQMSHGLQFLANYTWSKSIDDMPQATRDSNTEDLNSGESYVYPLYPANMANAPAGAYAFPDIKALDRGYSDINHPQAFSLSYVWDLPKVHNGFGFLRALVNDWNTSGAFQHHSGDALTIYTGQDISDTGLTQDRAVRNFSVPAYSKNKNLGGDCSTSPASGATVPKPCESWFNPAAFSVPVNTGAGTGFGNVIKDSLTGPGFTVWNTALTRTFHIWRESTLDFRVEYFDVLNHTILNNPSVSTGSASSFASSTSFGTISSEDSAASNGAGGAAGPRVGQFSLKYNF